MCRSTISSKDVFKALAEMEFDDFLPELQAKCTRHEAAASAKKARDRDSKKAKKAERDAAAAAAAASAAVCPICAGNRSVVEPPPPLGLGRLLFIFTFLFVLFLPLLQPTGDVADMDADA